MNASKVVVKRVLAGSGADITLFIPIAFYYAVDWGHHNIVPKVELTFVIEKWSFDVSLNYESTVCPISISLSLFKQSFYLFQLEAHFYAMTSVAILSWLHNPSIILFLPILPLIIRNLFGSLVVMLEKLIELRIFKSVFDMKCQRYIRKYIFFHLLVVTEHCIEERLLVAQNIVVNQMVLHTNLFDLCRFDYFSWTKVL